MSITAECLPSILNTVTHRESRKNPKWLLHPKVFKQFSTTRFSCKIFICFLSMSSATSIYSLASRSIQSGDRCNDIKLEHKSSISPYQYDFRSAPKNKTVMRSSPDSDCTSLEYPTIMVPRTFNPFCYGTSAAATWKRHSDKSKKYCSPIDGGELTDTSSLVGFKKTLSCEGILINVSHIITNFRRKGAHYS